MERRHIVDPVIIVMARYPEKGKVKSRLAKTIGEERALHIYEALLSHTIHVVEAAEIRFEIHWSGNPQSDTLLPSGVQQVQGDLGQRMWNAVKKFDQPVIIVGTDCPDLSALTLKQAGIFLKEKEVVFGPSEDGGYYLIGLRSPRKAFFENIEWSTSSVLEKSIEICTQEGLTFGLLPKLKDIDEEEDLKGTIYEKI